MWLDWLTKWQPCRQTYMHTNNYTWFLFLFLLLLFVCAHARRTVTLIFIIMHTLTHSHTHAHTCDLACMLTYIHMCIQFSSHFALRTFHFSSCAVHLHLTRRARPFYFSNSFIALLAMIRVGAFLLLLLLLLCWWLLLLLSLAMQHFFHTLFG